MGILSLKPKLNVYEFRDSSDIIWIAAKNESDAVEEWRRMVNPDYYYDSVRKLHDPELDKHTVDNGDGTVTTYRSALNEVENPPTFIDTSWF